MNFKVLAGTATIFSTLAFSILAQEITLTGVEGDLRDVLKGASLVYSVTAEEDTRPQDIVAAARADYQRLVTGLYSEGYFGGTVSVKVNGREASQIAPLDAPASIETVTLTVDPGPRFRFGAASVSPLAAGTKLPPEFAEGEVARATEVRAAALAAVEAWRSEGHAKASISGQSVTARHAQSALDVNVTVAPGPVLTFGDLTVTGNDAVRTERIVDIAGLPTGRTYSPEDLDKAASRLRRTGAFSSVSLIEADEIAAGDTLPIRAQVQEMAPRRIGYGAEVSSVDGLGVSGYWMHRNITGAADRLRFDGSIDGLATTTGGTDYRLSASYSYPRPFAIDTTLTANLYFDYLDEPSFFLKQLGGSATVTRILKSNKEISGGIGFVTARTEDALGTREYTLLTFPITGEIDRRDDPLNPRNGYFADASITPFIGFGDVDSGGRLYADGRIYRSLGADSPLTFAVRGQVGSVLGTDIDTTPADFLFYSGGGDTVRGQSYQSLGVDIGGDTVGGLSFAALSLEARYSVTDTIGIVGFYDAGFVGETSIPFEDGDYHAGAGLGLRYNTGIGPIRLDIATPVSGDDAGKSINVYIGIGQAF